jgi:hypothetical protein
MRGDRRPLAISATIPGTDVGLGHGVGGQPRPPKAKTSRSAIPLRQSVEPRGCGAAQIREG